MQTTNRKELTSLFWRYLSSSILISLSGSLGVIINSVIVGNLIGPDAVSAINLNTPIVQLLMTISLLVAAGGGMLVGYALGRKEVAYARYLYTQSMLGSLAVGLIFTILGWLLLPEVAALLCHNEALLPLVIEYLRVLLLGAPAYMLLWGLSTMIGVDGSPRLASLAIVVDNGLNLILAYLLIRFGGMGIAGSSLATVVGHIAGVLVMLLHFFCSDAQLRLSLRGGGWRDWQRILSQGAPLAVASVCLTLLLFTSNKVVLSSAGSVGIFVFSVCMNLLQIYNLFLAGTCRSLQTLGSVLIGKGDWSGFRYVLNQSLRFITIAMILTCLYVWCLPESVARLFGAQTPQMLQESCEALRIFALSFIPFCYIYLLMIVYKLLGENWMSLLVSFLLSLTIIPVLALIARLWPQGLWYSYLIAYLLEIVIIFTAHKLRGVQLHRLLNPLG